MFIGTKKITGLTLTTLVPGSFFMIYCSEKYRQVQQYENYFRAEGSSVTFCFVLRGSEAICLPRSPIGGVLAHEAKFKQFSQDWKKIEQQLSEKGIRSVEITLAPSFYGTSVRKQWLSYLGFDLTNTEITHFIPLKGKISHRVHPMELRILRKAPNYEIDLEKLPDLDEVHAFISQCRAEQGLNINIGPQTLKASFRLLPGKYRVFSARMDHKLMSVVVTVQVNDDVVYYFLPATAKVYRQHSPMVFLIQEIYEFYARKGLKVLDLGISSRNGIPQSGLIAFKERMGGIRSGRYTFRKSLIAS